MLIRWRVVFFETHLWHAETKHDAREAIEIAECSLSFYRQKYPGVDYFSGFNICISNQDRCCYQNPECLNPVTNAILDKGRL